MTASFAVTAEPRRDTGKGASRRMRRRGLVPGIVYGAHREPEMISLSHNELLRHLEEEAFYSHVLDLTVEGKTDKVILKDMQRHPAKPFILHVDFQRVSAEERIRKPVPLHFLNEENAKGVKMGGAVTRYTAEVEISCLPQDLPEFIAIDLEEMGIGETLHLSQINLPDGVALAHAVEQDVPIVSIHGAQPQGDEEGEAAS